MTEDEGMAKALGAISLTLDVVRLTKEWKRTRASDEEGVDASAEPGSDVGSGVPDLDAAVDRAVETLQIALPLLAELSQHDPAGARRIVSDVASVPEVATALVDRVDTHGDLVWLLARIATTPHAPADDAVVDRGAETIETAGILAGSGVDGKELAAALVPAVEDVAAAVATSTSARTAFVDLVTNNPELVEVARFDPVLHPIARVVDELTAIARFGPFATPAD